ncbi:MAG TPA: AMP-dependent synthetase/ligase [Casimicrobiaceae bacterium]|nr:AMP-dependent synthetase/ligase [Casimicrobiaceae bacterium]
MSANLAHLLARALAAPGRAPWRHWTGAHWQDVTAAEVAGRAAQWQAAFRREGYAAGDRVALCVRNGVQWVALDQAALGLGLVVVPLYVDDNPDNIAWCATHAEARLLVVDGSRMAEALRKLAGQYALPPIVVLRADADEPGTPAERFVPAADRPFEVREVTGDTLATICFTSGTSGRPKGVMLSHRNIGANVEGCIATGMARASDRFLSILPLSHMFERTGGYYLPLAIGAQVAFARGVAQLPDDLVSQRPTAMFAVPRIFEKFALRIDQALAGAPRKRRLFDATVARGWRVEQGRARLADRLLLRALRRLVARPVLARLGGRMRLVVVGGAALDPALARTFIGLGLPMLQGYGMTEASPVISVNRLSDNEPDTVGRPLDGVEVRIAKSGELLARGENVMLGYWRNDEATRAAIDADGWLHTGDVAEFRDERIVIRGRVKDILVMSNGEKLPPQDVEFAILHDPVFEQAMLVGEGKPYVVLLAVSQETDEKALLRRANERLRDFPRWMRVRRVVATREPWSVDNGLLTPTLKLKRPMLLARFKDRIDAAYASAAPE